MCGSLGREGRDVGSKRGEAEDAQFQLCIYNGSTTYPWKDSVWVSRLSWKEEVEDGRLALMVLLLRGE